VGGASASSVSSWPEAASVGGLKLLVYAALSFTSVCGLEHQSLSGRRKRVELERVRSRPSDCVDTAAPLSVLINLLYAN
jgi:hypothetical protein